MPNTKEKKFKTPRTYMVDMKKMTRDSHTCGFRLSLLNVLEDGFRGEHATLHSVVRALDLGDVHETGSTANEATTGKRQLRNTLKATLVQGAGPVPTDEKGSQCFSIQTKKRFRQSRRSLPNSGSPLECSFDGRMCFKLLERLEGVEVGIGVVQTDDEAHSAEIVLSQMVKEGATVRL